MRNDLTCLTQSTAMQARKGCLRVGSLQTQTHTRQAVRGWLIPLYRKARSQVRARAASVQDVACRRTSSRYWSCTRNAEMQVGVREMDQSRRLVNNGMSTRQTTTAWNPGQGIQFSNPDFSSSSSILLGSGFLKLFSIKNP